MNASTSIALAPLLGWPWLLFIALLLAAPLALHPRRQRRGRWARAAFIAAFILTLARPVWTEVEREPTTDIALMLVDESDSQRLAGRLAATRAMADHLSAPGATPAGIEWRRVTLGPAATSLEDEGTPLFRALRDALADIPRARLAGVVVLTDGLAHDPERRAALTALSAPVHLLLMGDTALKDRRLVLERAPQFGLVGEDAEIQFRVDDGPGAKATAARVTWSVDGGPERAMTVHTGKRETIRFRPQHRGQNVVDIAVEPLSDEVSQANNRTVLSLSGVRDRLRVVLISGEPYQGERLWRATLKADPGVDLVHFTILRLPSSQDFTPVEELSLIPFPTRQLFEEKLHQFDLVIFDRYSMRVALEQRHLANLAAFVRGGGAVLVAVGPEFTQVQSLANTPLAEILPARPSGRVIERPYRPALTAIGARHPVTAVLPALWREGEAWGPWYRLVETVDARGDVLMTGVEERPLLILDRVGEGRVAMLLSDQSWLWGKEVEGGGPYGELVRRLIHWLMKEPDLEEEALHAAAEGGAVTVTRQSLASEGGVVTVTAPDGATSSLTLAPAGEGRSTARLAVEEPGLYRLSDGVRTAFVAAGRVNARELADLRPRGDIVAPLAQATGGGVLWATAGTPSLRRVARDGVKAGRGWIGLQANDAGRVVRVRERPLLPPWAALGLLLGLLGLAWYRESR